MRLRARRPLVSLLTAALAATGLASLATVTTSPAASAAPAASTAEHQLTTTYASTNGSVGSVFDLRVKPAAGVAIESFDVNLLGQAGAGAPIQVYTRPGAAEANTTSLDGWTLRGTSTVVSSGRDNPTNVPIGFHLGQGDWGVAVVIDPSLPSGAVFANTVDAVATPPVYEDDSLALTTRGSWNHPAFAAPYHRSYGWNGTIHYNDALDTTIVTGPNGITGSRDASFAYSAPGLEAPTFECDLSPTEPGGSAGFESCSVDGVSYAGLADGDYTFSVRVVDGLGNVDPTPATRGFTVDTTAPDTSIATGPEGLTGSNDPAFTYTGDPGADVDHFECDLSPAEPGGSAGYETCNDDGTTYTDLPDGAYTFSVRAVDGVDNSDASPATWEFLVDTPAPSITATVTSTVRRSASGWYRAPVGITYTCDDGGSPLAAPCPVPVNLLRGGADRTVTRFVRTEDGDVATSVTVVSIDRTPPRVRVAGFNPDRTYSRRPAIRCVATDSRSGVSSCRAYLGVTKSRTRIKVLVRAVDHAGNVRVLRLSARWKRR